MVDYKKYQTYREALDSLQKEYPKKTRSEVGKMLYDSIPKEKNFQSAIIKWLQKEYPSAFVWKAAAGAYSRCGIPDICCILNGMYFGFEVKRPLVGKATALQLKTLEQIRAAGGVAELVSYPEQVEKIIAENMCRHVKR